MQNSIHKTPFLQARTKGKLSSLKGLLLLCLFLCGSASADDTDIYLEHSIGTGLKGPPMVMLTLDLRPNLGSTSCSNVLASCSSGTCACQSALGTEIFEALDLVDADGNTGADGISDHSQHSAAALGSDGSSGHWSGQSVTMFDGMRAVFSVLFSSLENVRVGMMVNHEDSCSGRGDAGPDKIPTSPSESGCSNGAYVLQGFIDPEDADDRASFLRKLAALPVPSTTVNGTTWNGHPFQLREMYLEYYRYMTGGDLFNAWLGYESFNSKLPKKNLNQSSNDVSTLLQPDPNTYTGSGSSATYTSPFTEGDPSDWACSRLFMVNTLDMVSNQASDSDFAIDDHAPAGLAIRSPTDEKVIAKLNDLDMASDVLGIEVEGDQSLTSYWVADNVNTTTNKYATAGGTGTAYDHGDPQQALDTLRSIFREILSVSTTFVAASVPVNVFNRAEVVDNLYLAIFQAEAEPRWPGNVKKLKIAEVTTSNVGGGSTTQMVVQDAEGNLAFSADDGRIKSDALTYWTDPFGEDVLAADEDLQEVSGKDGRSVMRGGAGQQIPGMLDDSEPPASNDTADARQLYTENPASANNLIPYNADAATATALAPYLDASASMSNDELRDMIAWGRGVDVYDEDGVRGDDSRDWMMADPMHSRPLVVNYGAVGGHSEENPLIRLFFGTNDGWFRAVQNTSAAGAQSGSEIFGFLPLETMAIQRKLIENVATSVEPHPYGVDGETVAFTYDADADGNIESGDKVWIYTGMRRGGKHYYAFDVSNPATVPSMKWKIGKSGDFSELGMTFSTPRVTMVKYGANPVPVLIFAGGYDGGWSGSARKGKDAGWGDSTEGNAIYVVNADTGALIWKAVRGADTPTNTKFETPDLVDAIPSQLTLLDADGNGITDRAYVGDTGGTLWRINLPEGSEAGHRAENWKISRLADFGSDSTTGDRRFFHAPDVVRTRDAIGEYHGVIIASGNRADPLETSVDNFLYLVKDRTTHSGSVAPLLIDETDTILTNDLTDITSICISGDEDACNSSDRSKGWKLALKNPGEKGLATPLTADGIVFFTSYLPEGSGSSATCAPSEGDGRLYAVRLGDGSAVYDLDNVIEGITEADRYTSVGPGIPPGAKPLGDHILLPGKGIDGNQIISTGGRSRWRIYWREAGLDQL